MSFAFVNGYSARCKDCAFFEQTGKRSLADWSDGHCTNKRHVRTHGGGSGRVNGKQHTCFDAEEKDDQMSIEEIKHEPYSGTALHR